MAFSYDDSHNLFPPIINHNTASIKKNNPKLYSTNESSAVLVYIDRGNYRRDEL